MSAIQNKIVRHKDGYLSLYLKRANDAGHVFRYVTHLSPERQERGRAYVAHELRRARARIREMVKEGMK